MLDFKEEFLVELKEVQKVINENAELVNGVLFSGGEPLLQKPALISLASYSKALGLEAGIDTNGSKPGVLEMLLKNKLVDFVNLDMKAPFNAELFQKVTKSKTFFKDTPSIMEDIRQSLKILKEYEKKVDIQITTTIVPGLMFKKEYVLGIAKEIDGLECTWVLQPFYANEKKTVDQRFMKIKPPSKLFLKRLRETCHKEFPNLRIEIGE